jgi:hypothetical protein
MSDHPLVRASLICPLCDGAKGAGLVACWPCFRSSGLKECDPGAERIVANRETSLAARPAGFDAAGNFKPWWYRGTLNGV